VSLCIIERRIIMIIESLISDIRPCGTMQFMDYSFNLPSSSVISIFISDSFRTLDYPDG